MSNESKSKDSKMLQLENLGTGHQEFIVLTLATFLIRLKLFKRKG